MAATTTLSAQQGLAYVVVAHGVLQRQSARTTCPVAQLQTLLALHTLNEASRMVNASTGQLGQVMQLSLPLLRSYVRKLVARKYVEQVRFYKRGARLLKLTTEGNIVATACQREIRRAAMRVLDWELAN
jgi:DNA-binding MarR family transcriptional regulator